MKIHNIDGILYDKNFIIEVREAMIKIRDKALAEFDFNTTILLSHVIAILHNYIEELDR